ncbi:MAG: hypothetical protein LM560_04590 [Desulfurococcaceae archaeon]|nr:hypothetical protein [Desulfurococcaceae archaeon]
MACFIVPSVLAVIVSIVRRVVKGSLKELNLGLLEGLLWGGAGILALEHVWHGEVVPWPPFLTAMQSPGEWVVAVHEMLTVGTAMTLTTVGVWGGILLFNKLRILRLEKLVTERKVGTTLPTTS